MKKYKFWLQVHGSLFLRVQVTLSQPWSGNGLVLLRQQAITLINSSPPSDAYMHQWTGSALVHGMACRLFGAKPLHEFHEFQWNLNQNSVIFIQENAFKLSSANMSAILSRVRRVNVDHVPAHHISLGHSEWIFSPWQTANTICIIFFNASVSIPNKFLPKFVQFLGNGSNNASPSLYENQ